MSTEGHTLITLTRKCVPSFVPVSDRSSQEVHSWSVVKALK
jgi:hypothetical protein